MYIEHPVYRDGVKENKREEPFIYTVELVPEEEKVLSEIPIVMVHGYGGSGMIFYQMFKYLQKGFKVYLIDIYGMGRSYRPTWHCRT